MIKVTINKQASIIKRRKEANESSLLSKAVMNTFESPLRMMEDRSIS